LKFFLSFVTMNKVVCGVVLAVVLACCAEARVAMPWMCLERCGEKVQQDLATVLNLGPKVYPWVSIEAYDLVYNASIKDCGYSRVGPQLKNAGISVHPMITTANILKLRDLWKDPAGFVKQAMDVARANKDWIDGFNIDFEPENGEVPKHFDAANFSNFLDMFGKALHAEGFKLTVDIADWCSLFEDNLLAKVDVDKFITMSTYTVGLERFEEIVKEKVGIYGIEKFGVGLYDGGHFTAADISARLDVVRKYNIDTIGIWMTPLPDDWNPLIKTYVNDN